MGYAVFAVAHMSGFANILKLPAVTSFQLADIALAVAMGLVGVALAVLAGALMQVAARVFGLFKDRIVLRALLAGVIFSVVGYFAPLVMFSGESQVHMVIANAATYGVGILLVMAVVKLVLLAVAFKSGYLGGPTFPVLFSAVCLSIALNTLFPSVSLTLMVAGVTAGALYVLFRAPLMVVLLTSFMLDAPVQLQGLIVLSVAVAMIVMQPLQRLIDARQAAATEAA